MSSTKLPRGKTGPTTDAGKQISSRNAVKHNCTSQLLIVPGEDAGEFHALLQSLTVEYQPETEMQKITVAEAARRAWELARVNREFDKSQHKLYGKQKDMHEWNADQQSKFERMSRYRTRAERAYARAMLQVEFLRKLRLQAGQRAFWENLQVEKLALSKERLKLSATRVHKLAAKSDSEGKNTTIKKDHAAQPNPWPQAVVHLSQVILVRVLDGNISLRIYPLTEDLERRAETAAPGVNVFRRFEFPDGIPAEYAWVNEPGIAHSGIIWTQRFESVQAWRAHLDWEAATANGRFLPNRKTI